MFDLQPDSIQILSKICDGRLEGRSDIHHVISIRVFNDQLLHTDITLDDLKKLTVKLKKINIAVPIYAAENANQKTDPWIHRSEQMKCLTCMWCVPKVKDHVRSKLGRCRKHAPTMNGYPVVIEAEDWCGDHKLDETKV